MKLKGLDILKYESTEFVDKGSKINIVNPQSLTEEGFQGKYLTIKGRKKLDLTRLDYLALGSNQIVRQIMTECVNKYDLSCPSSQMIMKAEPNQRLEKTLAEYHGMKESIVFTSGYSANLNLMLALGLRTKTPHIGRYFNIMGGDKSTRKIPTIFFLDSDSHFSLLLGVKIAKSFISDKCIVHIFPSGDYSRLVDQLQKSIICYGDNAVRIVVSDTLSSNSGKIFDIGSLCRIAEDYDCLLYLDEAHAVGTLGPKGSGVASDFKEINRYRDRILLMGTLTKTFSQLGGYVTLSNEHMCYFLRACSPQYIFSAPVPPWIAEATVRMIKLISGDFGEERRHRLNVVSKYLRIKLVENYFDILGSESQIVPVLIGEEVVAEKIRWFLEDNGFIVSLFKYPAVPKNRSLIRISLCSDVIEEEINNIVKTLLTAREKFCKT